MTSPLPIVITVLDRPIELQQPTDLQMVLLNRAVTRVSKIMASLPKDKNPEEAGMTESQAKTIWESVGLWLDISEDFIVNQGDRDWLEEMIISRQLSKLSDLMVLLQAFGEEEKPNRAARRAKR